MLIPTDFHKSQLSALVVLATVLEPTTVEAHLKTAQQYLRGWTFHSAFQYVSGKAFLATLDETDDAELRASWALAHVIAKEFAGSNNWSGAGLATQADIERFKGLAANLSSPAPLA